MRKELWSPEEDEKLKQYILKNGFNNSWNQLSIKAGLRRDGKSCRLRWINYLRPGLRRCKFSSEEIEAVMDLHKIYGNRWSKIARYIEGRTNNDVKNIWNSKIRRQHQSKLYDIHNHEVNLPKKSLVHLISVEKPSNNLFTQDKKEAQNGIVTNYQVQTMKPRKFPFSLDLIETNLADNHGINGEQELCPSEPYIEKLIFSKPNIIAMHSVKVNENSHIKRTLDLEVDQESSMSHMTTLDKKTLKSFKYSCESLKLTITNEFDNEEDATLTYISNSWTWYNNQDKINEFMGHNDILMSASMETDDDIANTNISHYQVPTLPLPKLNPSYLVSPIFDPINQHDYEIFNNDDVFT